VKVLHERTGNTLEHIGTGNNFMKETPIVQQLRERIDKQDCIKLKSFSTAKKKVNDLLYKSIFYILLILNMQSLQILPQALPRLFSTA
jgi:hypothetical protein